jgi:hypothetical protein
MHRKRLFIITTALFLSACAGTVVRKESQETTTAVGTLKVKSVEATTSPKAKEQLPDNIKFDLKALSSTIERALVASGLQDSGGTNTLDVDVTNVYIRGTFSAVMFGFLSGPDNISGNVRVLDPTGKTLRSFDVSASYAFGGFAGGQDSIRVNYLYEKFAELTRDQLRDQTQ